MMQSGIILKALSGFYYVETENGVFECRARGKFRLEKVTPLVGDKVMITETENSKGVLEEILPRKNSFIRPAVANIDQMVIVASEITPVTDPFLIDRVIATAELRGCEILIAINKCDASSSARLYDIYNSSGFKTISISALTGMNIDKLTEAIEGKISAFTGNSGVGKSSILNCLEDLRIPTGEVSEKLGRGRHTTRHIELFKLKNGALIADTPGFAAFDTHEDFVDSGRLQYAFREFSPYLDKCRYRDCAHIKEQGCAVLKAVEEGKINHSRHSSYVRMYEQSKQLKEWEIKK